METNISARPDPYFIHRLYGDKQARTALRMYNNAQLREMAEAIRERTGRKVKGKSRAELIQGIEAAVKQGEHPPTPAPRGQASAEAADIRRQIAKQEAVIAKDDPQGTNKIFDPVRSALAKERARLAELERQGK